MKKVLVMVLFVCVLFSAVTVINAAEAEKVEEGLKTTWYQKKGYADAEKREDLEFNVGADSDHSKNWESFKNILATDFEVVNKTLLIMPDWPDADDGNYHMLT